MFIKDLTIHTTYALISAIVFYPKKHMKSLDSVTYAAVIVASMLSVDCTRSDSPSGAMPSCSANEKASSVVSAQNNSSGIPAESASAVISAPDELPDVIRDQIAKMTARQICTEILRPEKKTPAKEHSCGERDCIETEAHYRARKAKEGAEKEAESEKPSKDQLRAYAGKNGLDCDEMKKNDAAAFRDAVERRRKCSSSCGQSYDTTCRNGCDRLNSRSMADNCKDRVCAPKESENLRCINACDARFPLPLSH